MYRRKPFAYFSLKKNAEHVSTKPFACFSLNKNAEYVSTKTLCVTPLTPPRNRPRKSFHSCFRSPLRNLSSSRSLPPRSRPPRTRSAHRTHPAALRMLFVLAALRMFLVPALLVAEVAAAAAAVPQCLWRRRFHSTRLLRRLSRSRFPSRSRLPLSPTRLLLSLRRPPPPRLHHRHHQLPPLPSQPQHPRFAAAVAADVARMTLPPTLTRVVTLRPPRGPPMPKAQSARTALHPDQPPPRAPVPCPSPKLRANRVAAAAAAVPTAWVGKSGLWAGAPYF